MKEKLSNEHLTKPLLSLLQENHEKMLLQEICHTPILSIYWRKMQFWARELKSDSAIKKD